MSNQASNLLYYQRTLGGSTLKIEEFDLLSYFDESWIGVKTGHGDGLQYEFPKLFTLTLEKEAFIATIWNAESRTWKSLFEEKFQRR